MALALLRLSGREGDRLQFEIQLGRNRYYSYAIGDGEVDRANGFAVLLNRKFSSPLFGPIPDHPTGRGALEIPIEQFDRINRFVQLASFRSPNLEGPAISDITAVSLGTISTGGDSFPTLAFATGSEMTATTQRQPVRFAYAESKPESSAMFLGALLPIIQNALPVVKDLLPVVGKLFGGGAAGGGGTAVATQPAVQVDQILGLLQQFLAQVNAGKQTPAGQSLSLGMDELAYAQNPAILAAAPVLQQLMPLLQQVLTPETVKAIVDSVSPAKVIGAIKDGLMEVGKLGLENNKELNRFIKDMAPSLEDPSLNRLLESMSVRRQSNGSRLSRATGATDATTEPQYHRIPTVTLDFTGVEPQLVGGRTRICYRHGGALAFPLSVTTPHPIHDARLVLLVKKPETGEIVQRQRVAVPEATGGALSPTVTLSAEQVAALQPGEEYLVCAYLLWRNKAKRVLGTSRSQLITIVGRYSLDRDEDEGGLIPLNDTVKHRDYWHKIWQGSFTDDFRRAVFECKYYVVLEPKRTSNARMETQIKLDQPAERKTEGRLRAGFIASPEGLNQLIPQVSSYPALNEDELAALRSSDFVARFHQAARFKANLHGRPGASAAIWVYPEIKLQKVVLYEASRVSDSGQVQQFAEHAVHVPVPAVLHYIGARTTS